MSWSSEDKVRVAVELHWTIQPTVDADGTHVVRIAELAGFIVTADSEHALGGEYRRALRSFLRSYFNDGQEPPYPMGTPPLPWQPTFPIAPQATVIEAAPSLRLTGAGAGGASNLAFAGAR